jgi:hypothetical protein
VSAIVNPIFSIPPAYGSGGAGARTVLLEDFNGDGKLDLAVTNHCADSSCTSGAVGGHALASVPVVNGKAKFSTSSLDAGIHSITAGYSRDQTFQSSTSPELKQVVRTETRTRLACHKIHPGAGRL